MNNGIYKITNVITNDFYIGSSSRLTIRKYVHFNQLAKNIHNNKHLQAAYNKYGANNFKFKILCYCSKEHLLKIEQWFIDTLKPQYNHLKIAGNSLGYKHSNENIIKMKNVSKEYNSKKVYQYDNNMTFIKCWNSQHEYARYYNISSPAVNKCLKKGHKCAGYIIKYNPITFQ